MTNAVGTTDRYRYETQHNAINVSGGREGQSIKEIVIHHWGARGQSFDGIINWFCYNAGCTNSCHYVVEDGRVACIASPYDTTWHAGSWYHNTISLGLECRPEATDGDYETVGALVADLWREWGYLPLVRHRDVSEAPTACPGVWDLARIEEIANKYYYDEDEEEKEIDPMSRLTDEEVNFLKQMYAQNQATKPGTWAEEYWEQATQKGIVDGSRPQDFMTRQEYAASELRRTE